MNFAPSTQYHPDWYAKAVALVSLIWLIAAIFKLLRNRSQLSSDTVFGLTLFPLLLGYSASWYHLVAIASYGRTGASELGRIALTLAESQIPALVTGSIGVVVLLTALFIRPESGKVDLVFQISRITRFRIAGTLLLAIGAASAALRFRGIPLDWIPGFFGLTIASMIAAVVCAATCLPALRTHAAHDVSVRARSRPAELAVLFALSLVLMLQSSLWHHFMYMVLQYW